MYQLLIRDCLSVAARRHQAIKDRLTALFKPTIEAETELCEIPVEMSSGDMPAGSSDPALQAGDTAAQIT